ncbi:hypothetical protein EW146_g4900 [Bondarzewia mesenterica]|uniref:DUF974-domain-containing protein n=1 Tax=Bondarzewia mesenterica TaxID=1095465 RepID=A0A4S4LUY9_9AGAM|nr:hypothetical protein EW146_g4900 [Bondarzewia mesenterica]
MDGPGHLLSLKVMRVSRPALASAWEPFYSSSPAFSAHSTASVLSLQGKTPLPGHPKTLRDLTNVTELLTLPSSFGAIQLGETFSGVLAVNNETAVAVEGVLLRIEMQTATNKILLAELGGPYQSLAAGDTLETVVHHEIKELGQHVLACTVTYQLPPGARRPVAAGEGSGDPSVQTFRKFYKFAVTNPLSVKTKVHVPRSPSALMSRSEREKVFLEVHIQNLTQEPMWFERMLFEPVQDADVKEGDSLFSGSMAMMQPQDARQYLYILSAISLPTFTVQPTPGTAVPLGRLDISWRSSLGEPGRLLTSMLSRRIPLIPSTQPPRAPASALPLHLQRSATVTPQSHGSRPPSRSSTPPIGPVPYRPDSPFRNRPMSIPTRPQSPVTFTTAGSAIAGAYQATLVPSTPKPDTIDVDLVVRDIPRSLVSIQKPFNVAFSLAVSVSIPYSERRHRVLSIAIQHVQPSSPPSSSPFAPVVDVSDRRVRTIGIGSPSPTSTPLGRVLEDRTILGSPRQRYHGDDGRLGEGVQVLPLPVPQPEDEVKYAKEHAGGVRYLGASALFLPSIRLSAPVEEPRQSAESDDDPSASHEAKIPKVEGSWDFDLSYLPVRTGFSIIGGVRVLLVEDRWEDADGVKSDGDERSLLPVRVLREWDVVGEVWVTS